MSRFPNEKIEKIKNIVLVVLFTSTVLLLYFFWEDINLSEINISDFTQEEVPVQRTVFVEDVVIPSYFLISFGGDEYTVLRDTKTAFSGEKGMAKVISRFSQGSETFAEEITEEQYTEVFKFKSVKASFSYSIPYGEFCKHFEIKSPNMINAKVISELGLSEASKNSVFVFDKENGKYYRITGENEIDFLEDFFQEIGKEEIFYYYPMAAYIGSEIQSDVIIPIYKESDMQERELKSAEEIQAAKQEDTNKIIAKSYFGNSFDFVRKIEESDGKEIYMYGYAEKVLIEDIDGSIEYKDEASQKAIPLDYFDALDKALEFAESHNAFQKRQGTEHLMPYLLSSVINPQGKKGYRFEFGFKLEKNSIYTDNQTFLIIEIIGENISYYYMKLPLVEEAPSLQNTTQETFSAINTLAKNYEYIGSLIADEDSNKKKTTIEDICERILSVQSGYYAKENRLLPCWRIILEGYDKAIYFHLYTAEPI